MKKKKSPNISQYQSNIMTILLFALMLLFVYVSLSMYILVNTIRDDTPLTNETNPVTVTANPLIPYQVVSGAVIQAAEDFFLAIKRNSF